MAKTFDRLTPDLQQFIAAQQMFFVASAPRSDSGHVYLSPKGLDSFRILSPTQVAYLDLTGSGNETAAHLQENGRITLMFCAFQGAPLILRLFGKGRTILPRDTEWETIAPHFLLLPGTRQIIVAELDRIQTSCGTGVPLYELQSQRTEMITWAEKKGVEGMEQYRQQKNRTSIDGLPSPY